MDFDNIKHFYLHFIVWLNRDLYILTINKGCVSGHIILILGWHNYNNFYCANGLKSMKNLLIWNNETINRKFFYEVLHINFTSNYFDHLKLDENYLSFCSVIFDEVIYLLTLNATFSLHTLINLWIMQFHDIHPSNVLLNIYFRHIFSTLLHQY